MKGIGALQILNAIENEGSFRGAAQALKVTQPYLSQFVQKLEQQCQGRLIDRTQRPLRLTAIGRYYLESRRRIAMIEAETAQYCADHAHLQVGLIRIASNGERTNAMLVPGVSEFARRFPGIHIELTLENHLEEISDLILSGKADVGIVFESLLKNGLNAYPLYKERYLLAVPDTDEFSEVGSRFNTQGQYPLLTQADPVKLTSIPLLQTVLHHERTALLSRAGGREFTDLNMDVRQLGTRLAFVASGICSAVCQETLIGPYCAREGCRFLSLENILPIQTVVIAWNDSLYQSRASRMLCDLVKESLNQDSKTLRGRTFSVLP